MTRSPVSYRSKWIADQIFGRSAFGLGTQEPLLPRQSYELPNEPDVCQARPSPPPHDRDGLEHVHALAVHHLGAGKETGSVHACNTMNKARAAAVARHPDNISRRRPVPEHVVVGLVVSGQVDVSHSVPVAAMEMREWGLALGARDAGRAYHGGERDLCEISGVQCGRHIREVEMVQDACWHWGGRCRRWAVFRIEEGVNPGPVGFWWL